MAGMTGIVILLVTVSCLIVLILVLIKMLLKYRKKAQASDSPTIKLRPCLSSPQKPYRESVAQYLLGCPNDVTDDEQLKCNNIGLTRLVHVQPSDCEYPLSSMDGTKIPRSTVKNGSSGPQIDTDMYRGRSYTDSPSPEGKSGIWRARESLFFKRGKIRKGSLPEGESLDQVKEPDAGYSTMRERASTQPTLQKNSCTDGKSKSLFDETLKVTGKPPLSPKTGHSAPNTPKKPNPSLPKAGQQRRYSTTMIIEKERANSPSDSSLDYSGLKPSLGSLESLVTKLGGLEVSLWYSEEERLLKVCVLDVKNPNEERSLIDSYVKVAFYLFEKPYKNEMQLWSNSKKSLVKRTFTYLVNNACALQRATLRFTIRRKNNIVKNKVLGKAILRLCGKDVLQPQLYILKLEHSITELHGELLVSVCHQATAGILRVGIIRAMDLAKTIRKTMGAPFVIVELSSASEIFFVKNTKQKSNNIHPLFDETFEIPISTDSKVTLDDFHLKITVFRSTFSGSNDAVGMILLGSGTSNSSEAGHWKDVTLNPHKTVMKWHKLRIAPV